MIEVDFSLVTPAPWNFAEWSPGETDHESAWGTSEPPDPACLFTGEEPDGHNIIFYQSGFQEDKTANANLAFAALARNACDVMIRRKWTVRPHKDGYVAVERLTDVWEDHAIIKDVDGLEDWDVAVRPHPFTALVAADEWYKENVEGR